MHILWNVVLEKFKDEAVSKNFPKGKVLAIAIEEIPAAVRTYMLAEYVRRVHLINGIFFYATRMKERNGVCDELECKMQIFNLQRHLRKGLAKEGDLMTMKARSLLLTEEEMKQFWFYMSPEDTE